MDETPEDIEIVQDAATVAYAIWRRTDFDSVDVRRDIDDEFASRVGAAAYTDSVASFAQRLAAKWGVRSFSNDGLARDVIHQYDGDGDPAAQRFLRVVRRNKALVVLEMKHQYTNDGDGT